VFLSPFNNELYCKDAHHSHHNEYKGLAETLMENTAQNCLFMAVRIFPNYQLPLPTRYT
jgi:hypothetical protein